MVASGDFGIPYNPEDDALGAEKLAVSSSSGREAQQIIKSDKNIDKIKSTEENIKKQKQNEILEEDHETVVPEESNMELRRSSTLNKMAN